MDTATSEGRGEERALTPSRSDIRLYGRAFTERWPVTEEIRAEVIALAREIVADKSATKRTRMQAAKLLLHADGVNVTRERTESATEATELQLSASVLRAALSSPQVRQALESLQSHQTAQNAIAAPQTEKQTESTIEA